MGKTKFLIALVAISLLGASCDLFGSSAPNGIVKSGNGGSDWQAANKIADTKSGSIAGLSISSIVFDPSNSQRLFAGTLSDGVYKSEDSGGSWTRILSGIAVYDLAIDPFNADTIYAAASFNDHGRVLRTQDGGKSWIEIFQEASLKNAVRSLALNPSNPQELVLGLQLGTVVKTSDAGNSWRLLQNYNERVNQIRWQNGGLYILLQNKGLQRSSDGGASFQTLTDPLLPKNSFSEFIGSTPSVSSFNRIGLSPNNPNLLYVSTNAGLFRSLNGGLQWTNVDLPVKQKDIQPWSISISNQSDFIVYVGTAATIYKSVDGGSSWQTQDPHTENLVNVIAIDPKLPQIVYAGIYSP